jgi:hypothetical protein
MRGRAAVQMILLGLLAGCSGRPVSPMPDGGPPPSVDRRSPFADQRGIERARPGPDSRGPDAGACPKWYLLCGGVCVSQTDNNCGACGHACVPPFYCHNDTGIGVCSTKIACGGAIIDPLSDNYNCGTCGTKCDVAAGFTCIGDITKVPPGECKCVSGMKVCGSPPKCVDTHSDPKNCGGCGIVCPPAAPNCTDDTGTGGSCTHLIGGVLTDPWATITAAPAG